MAREIMVLGEGEATALPDYTLVRLIVDADGSSHEDAYRRAAAIAAAVDDVLVDHAGCISRTTTTSVTVNPRSRWKKGESVRTGSRAVRTTVLEVTDFDELSALLAELVETGAAVAGLSWALRSSNPVHTEARREAAEQARTKAETYAAALGLTLGDVAWVAEPGMRVGQSGRVGFPAAFALARSADSSMPEATIDVSPEEITVSAAIEVSFNLT